MTLNVGAGSEAVAAERALQEQSANDRGPPGREVPPALDTEHGAPEADARNAPPRDARPPQEEPAPRRGEPPRSPGDQKRIDMQARFRAQRTEEARQEAEDMADLLEAQRQGMPDADYRAIEQAETEAVRQPEPPPQPTKRKVVVRGQEHHLSDEELIAAAQRGLAGDSYFDESRATLDKAKAFAQEIEALRAGLQTGKHPAGAPPAPQPAVPQPQEPPPLEQSEEVKALLQQIQYGDPNDPELAKNFQSLVREEAQKAAGPLVQQEVQRATQAQREGVEIEHSKSALAAFTSANPELAADDAAMAVMERKVFDHFIADLKAQNVDLSRLRNNTDVANVHMRLRSIGAPVRKIEAIFDQAKADYVAWRGGPPAPAPTEQPTQEPTTATRPVRQAEPRIEVNVDRSARRAAIPTQPPRTASPQRAPLIEQPTPDTNQARSLTVQAMQEQRRGARNGRTNTIRVR